MEPEFEFEFYLADRLKMTVQNLRETMTQFEFRQWYIYHAKRAQQLQLQELMSKRG